MAQIILASNSPRRQELLQQIGVAYRVYPVALDETPRAQEQPMLYVQRIAAEKSALAQSLSQTPLPILAADTSVVLGTEIFGKPDNQQHALAMLQKLSAQTHQVYSALSLRTADQHWQALSITEVTFKALSLAEIEAYWQTGEPLDKAGGYAIQGLASIFVATIKGSYSGVMGLPLFETAQLLEKIGINIIHD